MKPSRSKRYYTMTEAARVLGLTRSGVHEAIRKERLKATWGVIGPAPKGWRISPKGLREYEVSLLQQERAKKSLSGLTPIQP